MDFKRKSIFLSLCSLFLVVSIGHTQTIVPQKHILDNGLTVLISEMPSHQVVSVYALVKAGSATEGKYLGHGISHFLEHMLFKGTHDRPVGAIAAKIQAVGGTINASTGFDHTIYTITVPADQFDVALEVLADMLMNATMDQKEIESEREVILNEVRMHRDNPSRRHNELVFRNVYKNHPYRHPVIGYEDLVRGVTQDDLRDYYQTFYAPNNIIVTVAGGIRSEEVLPQIKEVFKDFKRQRPVSRNLVHEPSPASARRYEEEYPTELTQLSIVFSGVHLLHEDMFALDVLATILGQGKSSRLYNDLFRDKNLVSQVSAYNFTPVDRGFFSVRCILNNENVPETIRAITAQMEHIKQEGVFDEDLQKAKQQVLSDYIFTRQTTSHVAQWQALDEAFTGDYEFSKKYVERIRQVTLNDIQNVAKKYFVESHSSTVILKPVTEKKLLTLESKDKAVPQITKYTLINGLTVLLKEDHTFPIVDIRLFLRGGTREEDKSLQGLSYVMAKTWTKGTKARSAEQIAQSTEALGMSLDSYSGKNSLGLHLKALSEHFDEGIELFADVIRNPTFLEKEIDIVKEKTRSIIRRRKDNVSSYSFQLLKETLFESHPFRWEIEGSLESIESIGVQDVTDFYRRLVVPDNMVLAIFGDISSNNVLAQVKENLGLLSGEKTTLSTHHENPVEEPREATYYLDKEQAVVTIGFHGVTFYDEDRYGLEVLTTILGSPFSGRLFNTIREKWGEAYALGGNFIPGIDSGLSYFYVMTTEARIDNVKDIILQEIKKIQETGVSDQELHDVQTYLKGRAKIYNQTNGRISFLSGLDELYGLGYGHYQNYDSYIDDVSAQTIQDLAKKYFDLNRATIVITRPQPPEESNNSIEE